MATCWHCVWRGFRADHPIVSEVKNSQAQSGAIQGTGRIQSHKSKLVGFPSTWTTLHNIPWWRGGGHPTKQKHPSFLIDQCTSLLLPVRLRSRPVPSVPGRLLCRKVNRTCGDHWTRWAFHWAMQRPFLLITMDPLVALVPCFHVVLNNKQQNQQWKINGVRMHPGGKVKRTRSGVHRTCRHTCTERPSAFQSVSHTHQLGWLHNRSQGT